MLPLSYPVNYMVLKSTTKNKELARNFENISSVEAEGLTKKIGKFMFSAYLVVWYNIFYNMNLTVATLEKHV